MLWLPGSAVRCLHNPCSRLSPHSGGERAGARCRSMCGVRAVCMAVLTARPSISTPSRAHMFDTRACDVGRLCAVVAGGCAFVAGSCVAVAGGRFWGVCSGRSSMRFVRVPRLCSVSLFGVVAQGRYRACCGSCARCVGVADAVCVVWALVPALRQVHVDAAHAAIMARDFGPCCSGGDARLATVCGAVLQRCGVAGVHM